jgi:REP-associated tyrosine transposase
VLLPDHLHCIWELPPNDADFAKRWALIKRFVTKRCRASLYRQKEMSPSKQRRNEATLWQQRYWEYLIRDEEDLNRHRDYLHWNPVKHGYVSRVADWEYSTFHRFVQQGFYSRDWGGRIEETEESKFFGE